MYNNAVRGPGPGVAGSRPGWYQWPVCNGRDLNWDMQDLVKYEGDQGMNPGLQTGRL